MYIYIYIKIYSLHEFRSWYNLLSTLTEIFHAVSATDLLQLFQLLCLTSDKFSADVPWFSVLVISDSLFYLRCEVDGVAFTRETQTYPTKCFA